MFAQHLSAEAVTTVTVFDQIDRARRVFFCDLICDLSAVFPFVFFCCACRNGGMDCASAAWLLKVKYTATALPM